MKAALRQAYDDLDQARTHAWKRWSKRLRELKLMGVSFETAVSTATDRLLLELRPYYDKVAEAAGFEPADP